MRTVTVQLDESDAMMLEALGRSIGLLSIESVVAELLARLRDGVHRPGSWERPMVVSLFSSEWIDETEPDPSAPWRVRFRGAYHA